MKQILIIILILAAIVTQAQDKIQKPDFSKAIYQTLPQVGGQMHLGGSSTQYRHL